MTMASSVDEMKVEENTGDLFGSEYSYNGGYVDRGRRISPSRSLDTHAIDYWYGKKFFEGAIAQIVFEQAFQRTSNETIQNVDLWFERLIRNFAYREASNSLQTHGLRLPSPTSSNVEIDDYSVFLSLTGATMRLGTKEEKMALIDTIRRVAGVDSHKTASFLASSVSREPLRTSPLRSQKQNSPGAEEAHKNMSVYTTLLKEYGDMADFRPVYSQVERLPNDPETFVSKVYFNGLTFEGFGRSKTDAKHDASRKGYSYIVSQKQQH